MYAISYKRIREVFDMTRRLKLILAAGIGVAAIVGGTGVAYAMLQGDSASASLRATGKVGEQADGYLGVVGSADGSLRAQVDAVNIKQIGRASCRERVCQYV